MKFSKFEYENQRLSEYLLKNEARMETPKFFAKLEEDAKLDPKNCTVRETWVKSQEWCGEYKVVFGRHFFVRAWQRINAGDMVEAVMRQLSNNKIAEEITAHPIYWEDNQVTMGDDGIHSIAVIEEGAKFVCIYQCGDSFICPVTIIAKAPDMWFNKNTLVLSVSKTGVVSYK